jgi:Flp pilus assembly pilin Flp
MEPAKPLGGDEMLKFIENFRNDEEGAVTVDFVVLTAAIVVLGLAVGGAISSGATGLANDIQTSLNKMNAE